MKAVVLHEYGGPEKLRFEGNVPEPQMSGNTVLIESAAASVNPIDWKLRSGMRQKDFPLTFPAILGRDVSGVVRAVGSNVKLYSFQQAREDLRRWTEGLSASQLWATPHGFASVGFHVRHIAGSTDRLMSYLQKKPLNTAQLATLKAEHEPAGVGRDELLALIYTAFEEAERVVRTLDPATLPEPRGVGRQQLPTTVIGLLVHIAEHTQRHVGQAISAAKLAAL